MSRVYDIVIDRIVKQLEAGIVPWRRPWGGPDHAPRNAASRKFYRGVNVFLLATASYDASDWLTFRQANLWGGHVRKGERGWPVVFWSVRETIDPATGQKDRQFILRQYTVFNVEQCDGLPAVLTQPAAPQIDFQPIAECERIVAGLPANRPAVEHGGTRACYSPSLDRVQMPKPERFESAEAYYSVLFHELTHATGHPSRLNRPGITDVAPFGSPVYSREELVAEMGAAFLCGQAGIDAPALEVNQAAYLAGWLRQLRGDSRLVVQAAAQAQKAADWILGTGGRDVAPHSETDDADSPALVTA